MVGLEEDELASHSVFGQSIVTPRSDTDSSVSHGLRFVVVSGGIYHPIAEKICEGANSEMKSFRDYIMSAAQSTVKGETVGAFVVHQLTRCWDGICLGFRTYGEPMSFGESDLPNLSRYKNINIGELAVGTKDLSSGPPPGARTSATPRAASTSTASAVRAADRPPARSCANKPSAHAVMAAACSDGSGSVTNCSTVTNAGRKASTIRKTSRKVLSDSSDDSKPPTTTTTGSSRGRSFKSERIRPGSVTSDTNAGFKPMQTRREAARAAAAGTRSAVASGVADGVERSGDQ